MLMWGNFQLTITKEVDIRKLTSLVAKLYRISIAEENLEEKIQLYEVGYIYDEQDPNSHWIHSISLNINVEILGKRKSLLLIQKIAEETVQLDFCFFGSEFDAQEWDQKGIRKDEYYHFIELLSELLDYFQGYAGAVAIENDIAGLISDNNVWPNNVFSYLKISPNEILEKAIQNKYIGVGLRLEGKIKIINIVSNS